MTSKDFVSDCRAGPISKHHPKSRMMLWLVCGGGFSVFDVFASMLGVIVPFFPSVFSPTDFAQIRFRAVPYRFDLIDIDYALQS